MPKKFASGNGIRSYSRAQASPSGMPMVWVSMMALNSLFSGSGESAATTLIDSNSGRPALMPRTMTSTASGSAFRNAFSRRFLRKPRTQRGRPRPVPKAITAAPSRLPPITKASTNPTAPEMPDAIQNFWGVQDPKPAWARRVVSGTDFSFLRRASSSFSDPSTCSRRERWLFSTWRAGASERAIEARRDSAFLWPDSDG